MYVTIIKQKDMMSFNAHVNMILIRTITVSYTHISEGVSTVDFDKNSLYQF